MNTASNFRKITLASVLFVLTLGQLLAKPVPSQTNTTLSSFQVEEEEQEVVLTWKFEEIAKGAQTYVERAGMDMQFNTIGEIENGKDSSFVDHQPKEQLSFYRLVTKNVDGSITYHTTIAINR